MCTPGDAGLLLNGNLLSLFVYIQSGTGMHRHTSAQMNGVKLFLLTHMPGFTCNFHGMLAEKCTYHVS